MANVSEILHVTTLIGGQSDGVSVFSSSASWLEDSFEVDATDVLLGSFTCALKRGILLQGRLFVVAGERGGPRLLFHSSLFRRVTTLEVRLADVRAVEKKNSAGALSAIRVRLGGSGEALVFCSLIYRENAYRCVREAWHRAASPSHRTSHHPPPRRGPHSKRMRTCAALWRMHALPRARTL